MKRLNKEMCFKILDACNATIEDINAKSENQITRLISVCNMKREWIEEYETLLRGELPLPAIFEKDGKYTWTDSVGAGLGNLVGIRYQNLLIYAQQLDVANFPNYGKNLGAADICAWIREHVDRKARSVDYEVHYSIDCLMHCGYEQTRLTLEHYGYGNLPRLKNGVGVLDYEKNKVALFKAGAEKHPVEVCHPRRGCKHLLIYKKI